MKIFLHRLRNSPYWISLPRSNGEIHIQCDFCSAQFQALIENLPPTDHTVEEYEWSDFHWGVFRTLVHSSLTPLEINIISFWVELAFWDER